MPGRFHDEHQYTVEPPGMHIMNDLSLSSDDHVPIDVPGVSPNGAGSTCAPHAPSVSFAYIRARSVTSRGEGGRAESMSRMYSMNFVRPCSRQNESLAE